MMAPSDILSQSFAAIRAHRLRSVLTILGLTMGVATLIAVMTLVQGANTYVETKVANLGTNVFQIARLPFTATDFQEISRALKNRKIEVEHVQAIAERCLHCEQVGMSASTNARVRHGSDQLSDVNVQGYSANMHVIDTKTIELGRFFTETEDLHAAPVCLIGASLREQLFPAADPLGASLHYAGTDCTIIGAYEKLGSVLGQDQDKFMVIPMQGFLRINGRRSSLTIQVKAGGGAQFQQAQDEARLVLRSERHVQAGAKDDFYIATKESYISLWQSISAAFFAVFVLVSAISAVVGGIVIMNVMLVSVTERRKEIGVRRAVGATMQDIRRQFLVESLLQCLVGGFLGIAAGFVFAYAIKHATSFPTHVATWVAVFGMVMSSAIGLFFGIYPAVRASRLDPVVALRSD
ncbi:MAG: ABC transporter permease [Acidobacteria bacterium]|nr:ABC transporter permease [Acidobacteriota bacterium]